MTRKRPILGPRRGLQRAVGVTAWALGLAAAAYAGYVAVAWSRYGQPTRPNPGEADSLIDEFMPVYEVAERHQIRVMAPPDLTLQSATEADLQQSTIIRAIFRARELVLGSTPDASKRPTGLLAETTALGWRVLAEQPGREIVVGAVTQPWKGDVTFRGLAPQDFKAFQEPGFVKIVWTLRADPVGPSESVFRTETRVVTTDPVARARFRWYWARFSPGIVLIRRALLRQLKTDVEHRVSASAIR